MIPNITRTWSFENAKAHFDELVERYASEGAQVIEVGGEPVVVVISRAEYDRLKSI
jgi:prevent-host-death family protein